MCAKSEGYPLTVLSNHSFELITVCLFVFEASFQLLLILDGFSLTKVNLKFLKLNEFKIFQLFY